ncbi:MAG: hypothetical protein ACQEQV_01505 [Fibrobacterota bacterium]
MRGRDLFNRPVMLVSILLLVVGYVLLGTGNAESPTSLTYAPIVLVAVYGVLLPMTVLLKAFKK